MGSLAISNKILDKYFGYLKDFDNKAKKNLIIKLARSIETKTKKERDLKSMYGAWEDDRNSDKIISDIRNSRINKTDTENFK